MAVNGVPPELLEEIFLLQIEDPKDPAGWNLEPNRLREMRNSMLVCKSWLGPATRILYRVVHLPVLNNPRLEMSLNSLTIFGMHVRELHSHTTMDTYVAATHTPQGEHLDGTEQLDGTIEALAKWPNTRAVTITYLRPSDETLLESILAGLKTLSNLESLGLCMLQGIISSDHVDQILRGLRSLKNLTCESVGPGRVTHPLIPSRTLRMADLFVAGIGDDDLFDLLSLFRGVHVLHLKSARCRQVTEYGISRALASISESIEELSLDGAPGTWGAQTIGAGHPLQDSLPTFSRLKTLKIIRFKESFFDAGVFRLLPTTLLHFETRINGPTSTELVSWLSSCQPFRSGLTFDLELDPTAFGDETALRALCAERRYTCNLRSQHGGRRLDLHLVIPSNTMGVPLNP